MTLQYTGVMSCRWVVDVGLRLYGEPSDVSSKSELCGNSASTFTSCLSAANPVFCRR